MPHILIISILLGMLAGFPVLAKEGSEEPPNPCVVEPIFHCTQVTDDGIVVAHFGYRSSCPESDKPIKDKYIPIGDDNYFSPGSIDRGQPIVFVQGEHIDEFEVEFSAQEIKQGKEFSWTVLKAKTSINYSRTKDKSLDCNRLPYD